MRMHCIEIPLYSFFEFIPPSISASLNRFVEDFKTTTNFIESYLTHIIRPHVPENFFLYCPLNFVCIAVGAQSNKLLRFSLAHAAPHLFHPAYFTTFAKQRKRNFELFVYNSEIQKKWSDHFSGTGGRRKSKNDKSFQFNSDASI